MKTFSRVRKLFAIGATVVCLMLLCDAIAHGQTTDDVVANRLIVVYRGAAPAAPSAMLASAGADVVLRIPAWGLAVVQGNTANDPQLRALQARIAADPAVAYVVHDRYVRGAGMVAARPVHAEISEASQASMPADWFYTSSPQSWAVKQVGGYGARVAGGPAQGPWNASMGRGVRIAILDTGISSTHPDTAPNLIYSQSMVDQNALPTPCDDGSAEDQDGHGTFTASLAAGAIGPRTGMVVGVAPEASLLNIKVLQRMPANGAGNTAHLCEQGSAGGLMSWIIAGIAAASHRHADIISISAGGLMDTYSGEAEGVIAAINRAVYNATQAGALVIAALGNNGESLDNGRYVEIPAQATDALAVMATTNPKCAQDVTAGAKCERGPAALAYYSNYGTTLGAVGAPGGSLPQIAANQGGVSGFVRGACSTGIRNTQDGLPAQRGHSFGCFGFGHVAYVEAIGTSASAPLTAGVAAILKGAHPEMTPAQLANALRNSATRLENVAPAPVNLVNAEKALAALGQ
jgi:subtilisin family serine protease